MSFEETLKVAKKVIKTQDRLIAELRAIIAGDKKIISAKDQTIGLLMELTKAPDKEEPDEDEARRIAEELGVV